MHRFRCSRCCPSFSNKEIGHNVRRVRFPRSKSSDNTSDDEISAYSRGIRRRHSTACFYCNGAEELAKRLVFRCPTHDQAQRETWLDLQVLTDPRHLWSFLEKTKAVTRSLFATGNERETDRQTEIE